MPNKINKIAIAQIPLKVSQNPSNFRPIDASFSFSIRIAHFLGLPQKGFFLFNFNAVFNIVKINFSSHFYMGHLTVPPTSAPGSFKQIGL